MLMQSTQTLPPSESADVANGTATPTAVLSVTDSLAGIGCGSLIRDVLHNQQDLAGCAAGHCLRLRNGKPTAAVPFALRGRR